ncbi:MAG: aldo/keto reductase, partial [Patescibacteria group bacterium]
LNNKSKIPAIGLGVYKTQEGTEVENAVKWALDAGYRLIDTASVYGNEKGVGNAIRSSHIPREEIYVTTKLRNSDQGYENTLKAIDVSLATLGLEYIDLYLVHWPSASEDRFEMINKREETWKGMEEMYASGKARAIGVSNYIITHLEEMESYAKVAPAVNQVEFHPFLYQEKLLNYCKEHNILLEAYSPLVKARKLENECITSIAQKYNKTHAQVLLRWSIQHGCLPIPKSVHKERIEENLKVFDFVISDEDMKSLDALNENIHQAWNPEGIR